jgi:hypothetical protein
MYSVLFCRPILTKTRTDRQILVTLLTIKFHENPFTGSRVGMCTQTDVVTLIGGFLYLLFARAPKT